MFPAGYFDGLPTEGNMNGQAFRDLEWEKRVHLICQESLIGAQFGGKYFTHDVRVIRLPRHAASCPVGLGVSCSADRNIKAKITKEGLFLEDLEKKSLIANYHSLCYIFSASDGRHIYLPVFLI